ncbi:hypothetical protein [Nitrosomonas sp. Is37]|uniref:hypothetical protein n=1 Tax=Nitrosomonas sp. Is37 TaxID=3080535 RepID=UPI0039820C80
MSIDAESIATGITADRSGIGIARRTAGQDCLGVWRADDLSRICAGIKAVEDDQRRSVLDVSVKYELNKRCSGYRN